MKYQEKQAKSYVRILVVAVLSLMMVITMIPWQVTAADGQTDPVASTTESNPGNDTGSTDGQNNGNSQQADPNNQNNRQDQDGDQNGEQNDQQDQKDDDREEPDEPEEPEVGKTSNIYVKTLRTTTKATIAWKPVEEADGYLVYRKNSYGDWKRIAYTHDTMVKQTKLKRNNTIKVVAYATGRNKTVKGQATVKNVRMPKQIKPYTRGYTQTYGYKIIRKAKTKYGARYVWGASGPRVFDCSGFTYWTMRNSGVSGVSFSRTSSRGIYRKYKRYNLGRNLRKAQTGDILLFGRRGSKRSIFHVGMYDKNGYYVHANGKRVVRSKVPKRTLVAIIRMPGLR